MDMTTSCIPGVIKQREIDMRMYGSLVYSIRVMCCVNKIRMVDNNHALVKIRYDKDAIDFKQGSTGSIALVYDFSCHDKRSSSRMI